MTENKLITLEDVRNNPKVKAYLQQGNLVLGAMGYTDHGERHAALVAARAGKILEKFGYNSRLIELARIAGYLHDIGNFIGRDNHCQSGALVALVILEEMGMSHMEAAFVASAVGNHEENGGAVISDVSAALILADKSDVHRSRVRNQDMLTFDIHDRVNYSTLESKIEVENHGARIITLSLKIDTEISKVMDYFEIFLDRMIMCKNASRFLGASFKLVINDVEVL